MKQETIKCILRIVLKPTSSNECQQSSSNEDFLSGEGFVWYSRAQSWKPCFNVSGRNAMLRKMMKEEQSETILINVIVIVIAVCEKVSERKNKRQRLS